MSIEVLTNELINGKQFTNFQRCFYCGEIIKHGHRFIYWQGDTGSIALHPICVLPFATHLKEDATSCFKLPRSSK